MKYIKINAVYEKLKKAETDFRPVVLMAPTGFGKTAAVKYYYRRKTALWLTCKSGSLNEKPEISKIRQSIVVIDDVQWMDDEESIAYIKELLYEPGLQVLLLTRGSFPKYLSAQEMDLDFMRINEKHFVFGEAETEEYFKEREIDTKNVDVTRIAKESRGYPRAIFYYANHIESGEQLSDEMIEAVRHDIYNLWDGTIFTEWDRDFSEFVLEICAFEEFDVEFAEFITGSRKAAALIDYCRRVTSFLNYRTNGMYAFREDIRGYFMWKRNISWSRERICQNYNIAARYYELHNMIPDALKYYSEAGATERVKELLIKNVSLHPGTGHYFETRKYYFELPREEILLSPLLMAGMCMIYDLILEPEKSEEWYDELVKFEKDKLNSREKRREAKIRLAYLDIAMPHRGTRGMILYMKNAFTMMLKGNIELPEMSATSNLPSIMNGGLDFCEWSKNDRQIAKFMAKPLEAILGKFGNGLVTIALAESGFEKGTMEPYEVLTRLTNGYEEASHGGKTEMCFVSIGIQVRQHIVQGQLPSAKRRFDTFKERVELENEVQLYQNMKAFEVWMSLFEGDTAECEKYLDIAPNEQLAFCILDRYRYMIKLRCLIALQRFEEALSLSDFLEGYFRRYERHFLWMENEIQKSIIYYRLGDEHWWEILDGALKKAYEYHFVRIFSLEGSALLSLLREYATEMKQKSADDDKAFFTYFDMILSETGKVALYYPDYMKYIPKQEVVFTKRETQVLSMLCSGMSMNEICEKCGISYSGLKKHNRNIYAKLGASDRAEAERKAAQLGLVHR